MIVQSKVLLMGYGDNSVIWLVIAFVLTSFFAWLAIQISNRLGLVDHPQGRKQHARPTPLCGGLVLWGMLVVLSACGLLPLRLSLWDWLGLHTMALTGFLDDRFALKARYKSGIGLLVAVVLGVSHGAVLLRMGGTFPLLGMAVPNALFATLPLLILWFWFLPQAVNLMDGIDGLVLGFSLLVCWVLGVPVLLMLVLGVLLLLNFPWPKLFLGDCGALVLGTLMAILAVQIKLPSQPNAFFLLFAYPMVDVSLVVLLRWHHRQPLGLGDRNHLHHRMMDICGGRAWAATPLLLTLLVALPQVIALSNVGFLRTFATILMVVGGAKLVFVHLGVRPRRIDSGNTLA